MHRALLKRLAKKLSFWWAVWAAVCLVVALAYNVIGAVFYHQPPVLLLNCWIKAFFVTLIGPTAIVLAGFDWWAERGDGHASETGETEEGGEAEEDDQETAPGDEAASQE